MIFFLSQQYLYKHCNFYVQSWIYSTVVSTCVAVQLHRGKDYRISINAVATEIHLCAHYHLFVICSLVKKFT